VTSSVDARSTAWVPVGAAMVSLAGEVGPPGGGPRERAFVQVFYHVEP